MVHLIDLQTAAPSAPRPLGRYALAGPLPPTHQTMPLGTRAALLQVRSAAEWRRLGECVPQLGAAPDFDGGIVVGLLCSVGNPLHGLAPEPDPRAGLQDNWPLALRQARVHDGGGLLSAAFRPGTYLIDGTTLLELAYVPALRSVLVVDVDEERFYTSP